ncbi:(2Fe-2S) ferredoxin domain-containing protein [Pelagovum pacificum]|uniref:(2Fe-2S) ferredoxin domain-containing protein n=1 Tax=Pelagovum pacificum TaxID=2588711 RepID=A0A5C5GCT5_9RHOB|nr:(2Fe-2S) ferredoxin domain-containing protein [Pelagovum pacificum]QQA44328.1 (2Fe-2S) ferredoxin domain-containing protein [Pelagovum pacificum]TNY32553.1 (2Fe-2S) ferredoxin domain-containing protein [Pelagovum pacificum]
MRITIYLISASYLSRSRFRQIADGLVAASDGPARALRLEEDGQSLWHALDAARDEGAKEILLRPTGIPFSQSLAAWLPGAAADWLARQGDEAPLVLWTDPVDLDPAIHAVLANAPCEPRPIAASRGAANGRGWDTLGPVGRHVLVCTGPRCHMRDGTDLAREISRQTSLAGLRDVEVIRTSCLVPCNRGPVVILYPQGQWFRLTSRADVARFVEKALVQRVACPDLETFITGEPA